MTLSNATRRKFFYPDPTPVRTGNKTKRPIKGRKPRAQRAKQVTK